MSDKITYKGLIELVRTMHKRKKTGTVFVRTDDNHSVIIGVREGDIVSLSCGPRFGLEAIPLISHLKTGSYRVEDVAVDHHAKELPSSEKILDLLSDSCAPAKSVEPNRAGHASPSKTTKFNTSKAGKMLCALLQEYLGPIAPMVCEEAVLSVGEVRTLGHLHTLVDRLAQEIDAPEEAKSFTNQALEQLKGVTL